MSFVRFFQEYLQLLNRVFDFEIAVTLVLMKIETRN